MKIPAPIIPPITAIVVPNNPSCLASPRRSFNFPGLSVFVIWEPQGTKRKTSPLHQGARTLPSPCAVAKFRRVRPAIRFSRYSIRFSSMMWQDLSLDWVAERAMHQGIPRYGWIAAICTSLLLSAIASAGAWAQVPAQASDPNSILNTAGMALLSANAEIYVKGPNGAAIDRPAIVTLTRASGQFYAQDSTKAGFVKFDHMPYSEFT